MTLREQYNKLENDIYNEYQRLIDIGDYDILRQTVNEYYDVVSDEILGMIDNDGIEEVIQHYNIEEVLQQIFYNDRNGDERMAYLLGVEKENGIYVFDDDLWKTQFISFSDLNGSLQKIIVIEEIQNS